MDKRLSGKEGLVYGIGGVMQSESIPPPPGSFHTSKTTSGPGQFVLVKSGELRGIRKCSREPV